MFGRAAWEGRTVTRAAGGAAVGVDCGAVAGVDCAGGAAGGAAFFGASWLATEIAATATEKNKIKNRLRTSEIISTLPQQKGISWLDVTRVLSASDLGETAPLLR